MSGADTLAGWFARTRGALDAIGFDTGNSHVSLYNLLLWCVVAGALYTLVKIAGGFADRWIAGRTHLDPAQKLLAQKIAGIALVVFAFFVAIDILGINLTSLAVFSGALGLAVGFGLQKTLGNLIAGIILLWDRSIKPGDVIVVGDSFGAVTRIGIRAVSVFTRDGKEHLIPNENLMTQPVENWSYSDRNVRVHIPVGISYESDLKLAQQLMLEAAAACPRVLKDPKPGIWVTAFGDTAIQHSILIWISDPEEGVGNVKSDVLQRLWALFAEHGIAIPHATPVRAQTAAKPARDS